MNAINTKKTKTQQPTTKAINEKKELDNIFLSLLKVEKDFDNNNKEKKEKKTNLISH